MAVDQNNTRTTAHAPHTENVARDKLRRFEKKINKCDLVKWLTASVGQGASVAGVRTKMASSSCRTGWLGAMPQQR